MPRLPLGGDHHRPSEATDVYRMKTAGNPPYSINQGLVLLSFLPMLTILGFRVRDSRADSCTLCGFLHALHSETEATPAEESVSSLAPYHLPGFEDLGFKV